MMMEGIHSETYGLLLDTLITDPQEKDKMLHSIEHFPTIRAKADWAMKYISSEDEFAMRLAAFAVIEVGYHFILEQFKRVYATRVS
jgi:ribonucleotide reductase beta subunit family protein with ferritin-like domain